MLMLPPLTVVGSLPLSGGLDSASVAMITFSMCRLVVSACRDGNDTVIADMRRIVGEPTDSEWLPDTPQELCGKILHTCYMGTINSSKETRSRAKELAKSIGSYHIDLDMDSVVSAISNLFSFVTNFTPRFSVYGGTPTENLALQSKHSNTVLCLRFSYHPCRYSSTLTPRCWLYVRPASSSCTSEARRRLTPCSCIRYVTFYAS